MPNSHSGAGKRRSRIVHGENALPFDFTVPDGPPGAVRPESPDREEDFFSNARTPASQTKSKILIDTVLGWAGVMFSTRPLSLWYLDLFCGKGVYGDGTPSTPLELFEKVVANPQLANQLQMVFNDRKMKYVYELREHLMAHSGYERMVHKPRFNHGAVTEDLVRGLRAQVPRPPTFAFLDPFGYVGVSQDVIRMTLQDFGCDVMFFFSYHAIKRVLNNPNTLLRSHVEALLGVARVRELRERFNDVSDERENERAMLRALGESMNEINGLSVLSFAFRRRTGHASHHLAFVSKNVRGFQKAKEAMKGASSWFHDGKIPGLEFVTPGYEHTFNLDTDPPSIAKLMHLLVQKNRGILVTREEAYNSVTLDTPYVQSNVREALVGLVRDHGAKIFVDGVEGSLRGTQLPMRASILLPRSFRGA
jgi:three-Cys-motif partner protein